MSITVYASDECGHGFVSTAGLYLEVGGFPLQTFVALELIGGGHGRQTSFALKHRLGLDIFRLLLPAITSHFIACHRDYGSRLDSTQQDSAPEVRVLLIFDVEHDGPAPWPQMTEFKDEKRTLISITH